MVKKGFSHARIDKKEKNINPSRLRPKILLISGLAILCVAAVILFGKQVIYATQATLGHISEGTVDIVSDSFGNEMTKDQFGNVNVLLIGHGGEEHAGGYLADSIMVASWNPEKGVITFISLPRDLYVKISEHNIDGRINFVFARTYYNTQDFDAAVHSMSDKVEEITGLPTPYYAIIDFNGFENLIDTLGGVEIHVADAIYDTTYPDGNNGYETFHVQPGTQVFDGETALKYARSRHSTSDFDRSLRQQQIIKAVLNKMLHKENISNIATVKQLYEDYQQMVITNVKLQEIIGMFKYAYRLKDMFHFGYTSECSYRSYQITYPGCFLYVPQRDYFGGASVLLPNGATPGNVSYYTYTQNFAYYVAHQQDYLIEQPRIAILNGIDNNFARQQGTTSIGLANKFAVKLVKYGFDIVSIDNAEQIHEQTTVYIAGTGNTYTGTINALNGFIDIADVITGATLPADYDMSVILGHDRIIEHGQERFNYEM